MYTVELIEKELTMSELLTFYDDEKVTASCKNCPNYDRIWSCPPHQFNTYDYLKQYERVHLYLGKINLDLKVVQKADIRGIFDQERRKFSDHLLSLETEESVAVIAGNCYQCDVCMRIKGEPCILKDKKRYSLEALGLKVGEVAKFAGVELKWSKGEISPYLVTVGAIFLK